MVIPLVDQTDSELKVNQRAVGNVTVLDMAGKIKIGEGSIKLMITIRQLLEEGHRNFLLVLEGISDIDSSGLGEMLASRTEIGKQGGQLKLLKLSKKLRDELVLIKSLTIFDIHDDEQEALASFKQAV